MSRSIALLSFDQVGIEDPTVNAPDEVASVDGDIDTVAANIENASLAIEQLSNDVEQLDRLAACLEDMLGEGGADASSLSIVNTSFEHRYQSIHRTPTNKKIKPAYESVFNLNVKIENTRIAKESITELAKAAGKKIMEYIRRLIAWAKKVFGFTDKKLSNIEASLAAEMAEAKQNGFAAPRAKNGNWSTVDNDIDNIDKGVGSEHSQKVNKDSQAGDSRSFKQEYHTLINNVDGSTDIKVGAETLISFMDTVTGMLVTAMNGIRGIDFVGLSKLKKEDGSLLSKLDELFKSKNGLWFGISEKTPPMYLPGGIAAYIRREHTGEDISKYRCYVVDINNWSKSDIESSTKNPKLIIPKTDKDVNDTITTRQRLLQKVKALNEMSKKFEVDFKKIESKIHNLRPTVDSDEKLLDTIQKIIMDIVGNIYRVASNSIKICTDFLSASILAFRDMCGGGDGDFKPSQNLKDVFDDEKSNQLRKQIALRLEIYSGGLGTAYLKNAVKWAESKDPDIFEPYDVSQLKKAITENKEEWNKDYFDIQTEYLSRNFSKKRYLHLIEVRKYLADKGEEGFSHYR